RFGPRFNRARNVASAMGVINGRAYVAGGESDDTEEYLTSVESIAYTSCDPTATGTPATSTPTRTPTYTATTTPTVCGQYGFTQANATIVPGTNDTGNHCWNCTTGIVLPFPFQLYDRVFDTAVVDSKGTLQFESNLSNGSNSCLPAAQYNYTIFAEWDNYHTDLTGQGIYTSVTGTAPNRIFNIEWRVSQIGEAGFINFEIRLYENSPENRFDLV